MSADRPPLRAVGLQRRVPNRGPGPKAVRGERRSQSFSVGDRVLWDGKWAGVVKYVGPTALGPRIGVSLNHAVGDSNGIVHGTRYFRTGINQAVFVTAGDVTHAYDRTRIVESEVVQDEVSDEPREPVVGSRVATPFSSGTIRYVGKVRDIGPGEWLGIAVDRAIDPQLAYAASDDFYFTLGKNDGTVGGRSYFEARRGHGLFARPHAVQVDAVDIERTETGGGNENASAQRGKAKRRERAPSAPATPSSTRRRGGHDRSRRRRRTASEDRGASRAGSDVKGRLRPISAAVRLGGGGASKKAGTPDAVPTGRRPPAPLRRWKSASNLQAGTRRATEAPGEDPMVGQRVLVNGCLLGVARVVSATKFAQGTWVGVELDEATEGGHNGSVGGVAYFSCRDGHGKFVRKAAIEVVESRKVRRSSSSRRHREQTGLDGTGAGGDDPSTPEQVKASRKIDRMHDRHRGKPPTGSRPPQRRTASVKPTRSTKGAAEKKAGRTSADGGRRRSRSGRRRSGAASEGSPGRAGQARGPAASSSASPDRPIPSLVALKRVTVATLASHLARPGDSERRRARAAFRWIAANVSVDEQALALEESHPDTVSDAAVDPDDVLDRRTALSPGFAALYAALVRAMGMEARVVVGYCKLHNFEPGVPVDRAGASHAWNIVTIDGVDSIVDSAWTMGAAAADDFFCMDPEVAAYSHFPRSARFQLLDRPLALDAFADRVLVAPHFFTHLTFEAAGTGLSAGGVHATIPAVADSQRCVLRPESTSFRIAFGVRDGSLARDVRVRATLRCLGAHRMMGGGSSDDFHARFAAREWTLVQSEGGDRDIDVLIRLPSLDHDYMLDIYVHNNDQSGGSTEAARGGGASQSPTTAATSDTEEHFALEYRVSPGLSAGLAGGKRARPVRGGSGRRKGGARAFTSGRAAAMMANAFPSVRIQPWSAGFYIYAPLVGRLRAGVATEFRVRVPIAAEVAVVQGETGWTSLAEETDPETGDGTGVFSGTAVVVSGGSDPAVIATDFEGIAFKVCQYTL